MPLHKHGEWQPYRIRSLPGINMLASIGEAAEKIALVGGVGEG